MFEYTRREIIGLTIAFVVLSFCFAISVVKLDLHGIISILPIVMVGVGIGVILREIAQKYMAMKYGCEAEFRLWPIGLLFAFATSFFGFVFAMPGEIRTNPDEVTDEIDGKIGISGPMSNMVLALVFIGIAALVYPFSLHSKILELIYLICTVGFSVNSFLAAFNLLPLYSLDGIKVLKWNPKYWIVIFVIAVAMMLLSITIGAENMVTMLIGA
ncbi:metalloprotease [Methanobrevibacter sp. YE315]|uniref:metalloprotease n=1 Tax=Methanobrevibacter sp. YE315 TaxID=1609968 RepID=UPI000764DDF8|nr:metalloprotease [Methanobrevibacter sp. YE315]AMD18286.1 metalloprotease [Methanobrevibacter sp. YE315]